MSTNVETIPFRNGLSSTTNFSSVAFAGLVEVTATMFKVPTFSVIIPTSGRKSLRRTLRCLRREDKGDLEVIVVSDGPQPMASSIAHDEASRWDALRFYEGPETRRSGNRQRMIGIEQAHGRYLMFIDDDDITKRGAFHVVREAVAQDPDRIILFRIRRRGQLLWKRPEVALTNVATPQVVVPNLPGKVGSWLTNDRYESDFDFITECVTLQGDPLWNREVIAIADPFRWLHPIASIKLRLEWWRARTMIRTRMRRRFGRR